MATATKDIQITSRYICTGFQSRVFSNSCSSSNRFKAISLLELNPDISIFHVSKYFLISLMIASRVACAIPKS